MIRISLNNSKNSYQDKIDVNKADTKQTNSIKTIFLPELKLIRAKKYSELIPLEYYKIIKQGRSYYNRKWYEKAKNEFLEAYDFKYKEDSYYTHLIRTYRRLSEIYIEKNKYLDAIDLYNEMFNKCPNFSIADIKKYNKLVATLNKTGNYLFKYKELIVNNIPDYTLDSNSISFISESDIPRENELFHSTINSIDYLRNSSKFIPSKISNISSSDNEITYLNNPNLNSINHNVYRFSESTNRNAFIASSTELDIYVYNWNLELLKQIKVNSIVESYYELRCVDLSSDLSLFIFTNRGKAYILNSDMQIIESWETPHKDGYEKRIIKNHELEANLKILCLSENPTYEEIKKSFRKQLYLVHPDKNPNDSKAIEKTRELIQAYEYLTGEKAQNAFNGIDRSEYYWVDTNNISTFEVDGITFELSVSFGDGEDWIYGTGISDKADRIYLGCYSGKTYQINKEGEIQKKYIIPEDKESNYGTTSPISFIREIKNRLYILSYWYLYILKNDKLIKYLAVDHGNIKWFDQGIILQNKKEIKIFNLDGIQIGIINFKHDIKLISYNECIFTIVTKTKTFYFKLNINQ